MRLERGVAQLQEVALRRQHFPAPNNHLEHALAEYPAGLSREMARLAIAVRREIYQLGPSTVIALHEGDIARWLRMRPKVGPQTMPAIRRELVELGFYPVALGRAQREGDGYHFVSSKTAQRATKAQITAILHKPFDFFGPELDEIPMMVH